LQDPPKFTQIWIFGLKTNHLATLVISNIFTAARRHDKYFFTTLQECNAIYVVNNFEGLAILERRHEKTKDNLSTGAETVAATFPHFVPNR
jgi:hypothetical protein